MGSIVTNHTLQLATVGGLRWLRAIFRLIAIGLGALHTWAAAISYSMNPDGISYLDIGDAIWQGNLSAAVNPVWSPLYPWLLGLVTHIIQPSMRWEFPIVHLTNFGIYLFALLCFEFFWRQLSKYRQMVVSSDRVTWPEWIWEGIGYALFLWTALTLIEIWSVTPDMLMAAFVYLAAGLLVEIRLNKVGWRRYALLGALLGLGYLAKTIMWPLSIIFLVVALLSGEKLRHAMPKFLIAAVTFAFISGPFIIALSGVAGHFTFGESGKITYLRYVNGLPYPHWQGEEKVYGSPVHPSRKIFDDPPIYEFGAPVEGTYPISYNPSYWYEGAVPSYSIREWLPTAAQNLLFYAELFFRDQAALVIGLLLLYGIAGRTSVKFTNAIRRWGLILPALAALLAYILVYLEGRYVGVFLVLMWADLLANVNLSKNHPARRIFTLVGGIILFFMLFNLFYSNVEGFQPFILSQRATPAALENAQAPKWPGETAEALHTLGVDPGSEVAVIGYGFDSFWARLARVKVVAEMLETEADAFWLGDDHKQATVLEAFEGTGAEAIVAEGVPLNAELTGWHQVKDSNHYIYLLDSQR